MTNMELTSLTLAGQIMEVIERTSPVLGWDVWAKVAEVNDWNSTEVASAEYRRFKSNMADLERAGHIVPKVKNKNRAKHIWDLTAEGEEWWLSVGRAQHTLGADKDETEKMSQFVTGKWMKRRHLPRRPSTWSKIAAAALRGEIDVAIRYTPDTTAQKTGGGGE